MVARSEEKSFTIGNNKVQSLLRREDLTLALGASVGGGRLGTLTVLVGSLGGLSGLGSGTGLSGGVLVHTREGDPSWN